VKPAELEILYKGRDIEIITDEKPGPHYTHKAMKWR
jgi:hypothetical protein